MSFSRNFLLILIFILFLAMIPAANYSLQHIGTICAPNTPCVVPVWFKPVIYAPSGVVFAGSAFVLRDILQRLAGVYLPLLAVTLGTALSYLYVDSQLAIAGCSAYFLSEIADTFLYSVLQKYNLAIAILVSASIGLAVDSIVFLHLAFHNYEFLPGQIIGKFWMVLLSIPFINLCRNKLIKTRIT